jgi:hypothetical protein
LIFTGTNPADAANWKQQGRYFLSAPLGMNGHLQVGGDMLILTVDGIVPVSQAISKDAGQLEWLCSRAPLKALARGSGGQACVRGLTLKNGTNMVPSSSPRRATRQARHCLRRQ